MERVEILQENIHTGTMAYEKTYVMLKPGVLQRRLTGVILQRLEQKGLTLAALKTMIIPREVAEEHYAEHSQRPFFQDLVNYTISGPVVAMVVCGEDAIARARALAGPTRIEEAPPGTIRGDFAAVTRKNVIHTSDCPESARREIALFFSPGEILEYEDPNADWIC